MAKAVQGTVERVLEVAAALLRQDGPNALTTRRVCEGAGITAPTLYHHFGDKDGLLRALAQREMTAFLARKRDMAPSDDALADLLRGWDDWIDFARSAPELVAALLRAGEGVGTLRDAAEAIVLSRLQLLPADMPLNLPAKTAAKAMVAGANTVVQLLLERMDPDEFATLNRLMRDAMMRAILAKPPPDRSGKP